MYEDFPALGRPTTATLSGRLPDSSSGSTGGSFETKSLTSASTPRPCSALVANTGSPNLSNSDARQSSSGVSHLFAAITHGTPDLRTRWMTSESRGVMPARASTTTTHTAESSTASAAWLFVSSSRGSFVTLRSNAMPPVSTSIIFLPRTSTSRVTRSRVTPGWSNTMATRFFAMRLKSALLPVLGLPTRDTTFILCSLGKVLYQKTAIA